MTAKTMTQMQMEALGYPSDMQTKIEEAAERCAALWDDTLDMNSLALGVYHARTEEDLTQWDPMRTMLVRTRAVEIIETAQKKTTTNDRMGV